MELVVVTGMSGAGKTQAMNILEDNGYYCLDNLPPILLPKFIELTVDSKQNISKIAVCIDLRGGVFFKSILETMEKFDEQFIQYKIVYLEANKEVLVKRFKENRRPHFLSMEGSLLEGITREQRLLEQLKEKADYIIDTSDLTLGMLRNKMRILYDENLNNRFPIIISSFGFKNGISIEADLVFDARFIPNPYYIEELKHLTGKDEIVKEYIFKSEQTGIFIDKIVELIQYLLVFYKKEGKTQLTIGIGCTGGQHRSVAIAEQLGEILKENNFVNVIHRDCKN